MSDTMNTGTPLVSVIMSVYNTASFLEETCNSLLDQTFSDFEVIAINDGSTDDSQKILDSFAQRDKRFKLLRSVNQGPAKGRNAAFEHAQGKFIAIVDSDDICKPHRFEKQVEFLLNNPGIHMVGSYYKQIDSKGRPVKSIDELPTDSCSLKEYLMERNPICHGTVMLSRKAFETLGGYRPIMHQAEDYDLFLRAVQKYDIALLPEVLYYHRIHENSLSTRKRLEQLQMRNFVITLHRERLQHGSDRLGEHPLADQKVILKHFLEQDLIENRDLYSDYLSELGRKYYRIGEAGAALHNLKVSLTLTRLQPRTLRYYLKACYRKLRPKKIVVQKD